MIIIMPILFLINAIIELVLFLVSMITIRHCSRALSGPFYFGLSILLNVITVMSFTNIVLDNIWLYILQVLLNIGFLTIYCLCAKKITYDFSNKILSWNYIFHSILNFITINQNKNTNRIIGKVLPYNNYQLKYNGRYIEANDISTAGATLISGSIGSGKTYGMVSLIKQDINNGKSVIFSEYKGDPKVVDQLVEFAKLYDYKIYVIHPTFNNANFNYDPLKNLNNSGRIEAIINMRKWSIDGADAHYRTSTQLLLQKLIGDFSHEYEEKLKNINNNTYISYTGEFYQYVKRYSACREEWDAYSTVSKLLELLMTSSLEPMFKGTNGNLNLDFKESIKNNEKFIVIASFISSNKELATSFSSLMFKDILDTFTTNTPLQNISLYSDEFGTLENPFIIKDVLEKGRSAKIATCLALQDINQIVIQTNEAYLNSILGIINTFIVYSGCTRVTAEKFAGVQLLEIEPILMNLRKPINGRPPTALYISKYPSLNKRTNSEVFRFEPYIFKTNKTNKISFENKNNSNNVNNNIDNIKSEFGKLFNNSKNINDSNNSNNTNENTSDLPSKPSTLQQKSEQEDVNQNDLYNDFI